MAGCFRPSFFRRQDVPANRNYCAMRFAGGDISPDMRAEGDLWSSVPAAGDPWRREGREVIWANHQNGSFVVKTLGKSPECGLRYAVYGLRPEDSGPRGLEKEFGGDDSEAGSQQPEAGRSLRPEAAVFREFSRVAFSVFVV